MIELISKLLGLFITGFTVAAGLETGVHFVRMFW